MPYRLDLAGQKFNMLTVVKPVSNPGNGVRWLCVCDCGNETVVVGSDVKRGETKSCGCYRGTTTRKYKDATINHAYKTHCQGAKQRGWGPLSRPVWEEYAFEPCFYCGGKDTRKPVKNIIPRLGETVESLREEYSAQVNGIDRVDNEKGYVAGNMVPSCFACNQMKMGRTQFEFLDQVRRIYENCRTNKTR